MVGVRAALELGIAVPPELRIAELRIVMSPELGIADKECLISSKGPRQGLGLQKRRVLGK